MPLHCPVWFLDFHLESYSNGWHRCCLQDFLDLWRWRVGFLISPQVYVTLILQQQTCGLSNQSICPASWRTDLVNSSIIAVQNIWDRLDGKTALDKHTRQMKRPIPDPPQESLMKAMFQRMSRPNSRRLSLTRLNLPSQSPPNRKRISILGESCFQFYIPLYSGAGGSQV